MFSRFLDVYDFDNKKLSKINFVGFSGRDYSPKRLSCLRPSPYLYPCLCLQLYEDKPFIFPEDIPLSIHTICVWAACSDFPIIFPDHIRHLHIEFSHVDKPEFISLFEHLPVSLEILSMPVSVPISNPPPLLKFINLPLFLDDEKTTLLEIAADYFESIPSLVVIRFGHNFFIHGLCHSRHLVVTRDDVS